MTTLRLVRVFFLAALCAGMLVATSVRAQAPLIDGFGGTVGYGTECLSPNDDGTSVPIDLTPSFPNGLLFFGQVHTTAYINTNGNITFRGAVPTFTPSAFPIAPCSSVDTRMGGSAICQRPKSIPPVDMRSTGLLLGMGRTAAVSRRLFLRPQRRL